MKIVLLMISLSLMILTFHNRNKYILNQSFGHVLKTSSRLFLLWKIFILLKIILHIGMFFNSKIWVVLILLQMIYGYVFVINRRKLLSAAFAYQHTFGYYTASNQVPDKNYDKMALVNNGHRTNKENDEVITRYFREHKDDKESLDVLFGPKSLLHCHHLILKKMCLSDYGVVPYDYKTKSKLNGIPNEFFLLVDLSPKYVYDILCIYNGLYAIKASDYQFNQLIRVLGHVTDMAYVEKDYVDAIEPFAIQALKTKSIKINRCYRSVKEKFLLKMYFRLLIKAGATNVSSRLFNNGRYIGETSPNEHMDILRSELALNSTANNQLLLDHTIQYYKSNEDS